MAIERIEIDLLKLPYVHFFETSFGRAYDRTYSLIKVFDSDINLRKAFTMCIDHKATVQAATEGNGTPVKANTPPFSWAHNPDVPDYVLDVEGAKKLIESSGWALGSDGIYAMDGVRLATP